MTLPDERVFTMLQRDFEVGWKNIDHEDYVGLSHGYSLRNTCVGTTNGAGAHNVQIFVLAPDLTVLHALPGFWHPEDLARELEFAKVLDRLWRDDTRSRAEKRALGAKLQMLELRNHPRETFARSTFQSFDLAAEMRRAKDERRDTLARVDGKLVPKALNVIVHERMAARPFVPFEDFDVSGFIDYGRSFYDNNLTVDRRGRRFSAAERAVKRRAITQRKAERKRRRGRS